MPLIISVNSLPSGGMIILVACGKIIHLIAFKGDIPTARAASNCPLSIASMAALNISAIYAASWSDKANIAACIGPEIVNGPNIISGYL